MFLLDVPLGDEAKTTSASCSRHRRDDPLFGINRDSLKAGIAQALCR